MWCVVGQLKLRVLALASVCVAGVALAQPGLGQAPPGLKPEVRQALEETSQALSPLAVTWERVVRFPSDPNYVLNNQTQYVCQGNMFYARLTRTLEAGAAKMIIHPEFAFDGESFYNATGFDHSPMPGLLVQRLDALVKNEGIRRVVFPEDDYFHAAGIEVPSTYDAFGRRLQSLILFLINGGARVTDARRERINEADTEVVELTTGERKYRFWLDPAMRYTVRRQEQRTRAGEPVAIVDNDSFIKLAKPELWLPKHARVRWHTWYWHEPGKLYPEPRAVVEYTVSEMAQGPYPHERFRLDRVYQGRPGAMVADSRLMKGRSEIVQYRVPADPGDLDKAIQAAVEGREFIPFGRSRRWRLAFLAVNIAAVLALVVTWGVRRYRRRRAA
jgi:hypothetical protein